MWSHPSEDRLNVLTACLTIDPHRSLPFLYDGPSQLQVMPLAAALELLPASSKVLAIAGIAQSDQILYHICK